MTYPFEDRIYKIESASYNGAFSFIREKRKLQEISRPPLS